MFIFLIPGAILAGFGLYILFKTTKPMQNPVFAGEQDVASSPASTGLIASAFSAISSNLGVSIPSAVANWKNLADKYAEVYPNLDPEEILAIVWKESTGNPEAYNPNDPSWGLMGVEPLIARAYGGYTDTSWQKDPEKNMRAGAGFLSFLKAKYEDLHPLTGPIVWVVGYNEGETKMLRGEADAAYAKAFISNLSVLHRYYKT